MHGFTVRANLGPLADNRQIKVEDASTACCDFVARGLEEEVGGRPLPLRVAGREVLANVALAERAQDRIGQSVQGDVGV